MPEGPSILIAREHLHLLLRDKQIRKAYGNAGIDMEMLAGKKIKAVHCWGKHLLIELPGTTIRVHFLMFGSYTVDLNEKQARSLRLALEIDGHVIYFFTCAVKLLPGKLSDLYDWEADVLNKKWNPRKARVKLKAIPRTLVCDALLDQTIFSGVGNIIKNEVLYRVKVHPESKIKSLPPARLSAVIREARNYSFDFLAWKRLFVLKKHWLVHTKKSCQRCELPIVKKYCGKTKRRTFFCKNCQVKYT